MTKTPYQKSLDAGYSDAEIMEFLSKDPKYSEKITKSREAGYDEPEIMNFAKNFNPNKKTNIQKVGRLAGQFALGAAQMSPPVLALEGANILSKHLPNSYESETYRQNLNEDIDAWEQAKELGGFPGRDEPWNQKDEEQLMNLKEQKANPEKAEQFAHGEIPEFGLNTLVEKATGINLEPEGALEHAAHWLGFLKNPTNVKELFKIGAKPKELIKYITPTGTEALSSLGAGVMLNMAEEGHFGPMGTIAAAIVGDLGGRGVAKIGKALSNPRKSIVSLAAKFTKPEKLDIQKSLIKDFRDAGIQADLGTITDNNLIKMAQSRLAQSSLTGKPLQEFRQKIASEIKDQYKKIADELGNAKFETLHEAGEVGKEYITHLKNEEKKLISGFYKKAGNLITEKSTVLANQLGSTLKRLEKELAPGAIKSTEQKAVVDLLSKLKADVFDAAGKIKPAKIQDLMNNKTALNEIINYEVQGGQKQLLKQVVHDLDTAIMSHKDKKFISEYATANKRFSEHAKTYRNDNINKIITSQDPATVMNKMNNIQGIRDIGKALGNTFEGKETFDSLKRLKLDQMIGNKMADNVSEQVKLGTFSNLLKNPKDMQLAKELLGSKAFAELEKLQKVSGKLAQTAQQFMNASQSGVTVIDAAVIAKVLNDMAYVLTGNPWPLAKTAAGLGSSKYLSSLLADVTFLKSVEDAILASSKNDMPLLLRIGKSMEEPIKEALQKSTVQQLNTNQPKI